MRLGMFMMPLHPAGRPMHEYLAEDTEKAILLDKLGFDELFIGEHFTAATEPYPSPLMFAASLLPKTERLIFGTGVYNAPLHHPAMIAAEAAQFDHMSKGRFILGIGSGSTPTDVETDGRAGRSARARQNARRVDRDDPADLGERSALRHRRQILDHPHQGFAQSGAQFRLAAEALPEAASADRDPVVDAGLAVGQGRRPQGLERDLGAAHVGERSRQSLAALPRGLRGGRPRPPTAINGASAARSSSPAPTRRRAPACSRRNPATAISTITCTRSIASSDGWRCSRRGPTCATTRSRSIP